MIRFAVRIPFETGKW